MDGGRFDQTLGAGVLSNLDKFASVAMTRTFDGKLF